MKAVATKELYMGDKGYCSQSRVTLRSRTAEEKVLREKVKDACKAVTSKVGQRCSRTSALNGQQLLSCTAYSPNIYRSDWRLL